MYCTLMLVGSDKIRITCLQRPRLVGPDTTFYVIINLCTAVICTQRIILTGPSCARY